ncbi:hypothetical protein [Paeniglutamicibacter sp. NPDC091659]|uniref:hypothetical protein n=1 Tax=Paeniglutamicibacter sp. NPDC091659 TaxID=3364389 RepID=UPI00381A8D04
MDASAWIAVVREDGEAAGYLEPVTSDYDVVQPRSVLGHVAGEQSGYLAGEDLQCERVISKLIKPRKLKYAPGALSGPLAILEVSPHGIMVADALLVKALAPSEKAIVSWPDVEHCHEPAVSGP